MCTLQNINWHEENPKTDLGEFLTAWKDKINPIQYKTLSRLNHDDWFLYSYDNEGYSLSVNPFSKTNKAVFRHKCDDNMEIVIKF